ncbi:MAG: hypothetical protein FD176_1154 [Rhodospirillaceae bacterium]|nr:MAG: hypothetical protein FD176_1154 [Rhodospirillaceae bacterium]TNC97253.1 MAG: hypothetical protein FD119_1345 [Stygiobacter sp.]
MAGLRIQRPITIMYPQAGNVFWVKTMRSDFSLTEAATVTGMKVKMVHKAVENQIVEVERTERTALSANELLCLQLEGELAEFLPLNVRRRVIRDVARQPRIERYRASDVLVVEVASARRRLASSLRRLNLARRAVTSNPDIMGGELVIKGTRVPVHSVAAMVEQGASVADILAGYPSLSSEQIELAVIYASAYPQRGRPRKQPWGDTPVRLVKIALKDLGD